MIIKMIQDVLGGSLGSSGSTMGSLGPPAGPLGSLGSAGVPRYIGVFENRLGFFVVTLVSTGIHWCSLGFPVVP